MLGQSSITEPLTTNLEIAISSNALEFKEKEIESDSDDQLLINIERNSIFDRLSKQSEDE